MQDFSSMFADAIGMFLFLGAELSILFIIICAAVNLLQLYIPDSKIQSLLGASHGRGYFLAAMLGAVTPFCSCSTIPMLRGLLKAKAGFGPTLTFLFASPLLNPIIIVLFVATFGLKVSIIYTCIALITATIAGFILNKMQFEKYVIHENPFNITPMQSCCTSTKPQENSKLEPLEPMQTTQSTCCDAKQGLQPIQTMQSPCCDSKKPMEELKPIIENAQSSCCASSKPLQAKASAQSSCCSGANEEKNTSKSEASSISFKEKLRWAFVDAWRQFKQLFPYLLLGVTLGALVYGFVPSDFIAKYASGDSIFAVPIAAVIGIPLYVRVEALIPLSAVLVGKGMGLGAVMALIIGGGGASLTEVILLKSMFRLPMILAFLTVILGMAITAGYLFQYMM